ncbi:hypothetical protein BH11BAC1_BH11BAC1_07630 [soil metagenome]
MKKSLLIIGLALSVVAASAQSRRTNSTGTNAKASKKVAVYSEVTKSNALPTATPNNVAARHGNGGNHTTVVTGTMIGMSGNCLGPAFGPKTNLWYDQDINTVVFTHRSATPTNGLYLYDGSTDGGVTWTSDNLTGGDTTNVIRGRYPHGVIYNPAGNTDPNNAYVTTIGPTNDGAAAGFCSASWNGLETGNAQIGAAPAHIWKHYNCDTLGLNTLIPSGGQIVKNTGVSYFVVNGYNGTAYNDTICLIKGVWNGTTNTMDYEFIKIYMPVCLDAAGVPMLIDVNTAWNDAGDIGYITILGNDWACNVEQQDTTFGLIVLKTTDGGATWNKQNRPWLSQLDPVLANGGFFCTTAFEHDAAVDKNNNLHIAVAVGAYAGGGSISTGPGFWALFDITTQDGGITWGATVVGRPMSFRGAYGIAGDPIDVPINEDSRPQISRSWDGSKMFFSWFDTDTILFGSTSGNIFPDMFSIGLDVDAELWTAQVNHTQNSGTDLDGASHWGNIGYYTINNGAEECIPMVGGIMLSPPTSTGGALQYEYISGACMSNYTNSLQLIPLPIIIGVNDPKISASIFNVSSNYPNPYSGKTAVDVTLAKVNDVTIEISNAVGQILSTSNYKNLHAGVNTLTIDGSSLSKGLYFYTVKAGLESSTKTMSVE